MMNISIRTLLANVLALFLVFGQCLAVNVRDFGALGDGRHIDSPAINAALEQVAQAGGGTVTLPEGVYLCYSIHLQSGVTLRLERGAILRAAPVSATDGYDAPEANDSPYQDFGHSHWHNSLLWGEGLHDVTLEGEGLIDGTDVLMRGAPRRNAIGQQPTTANKAVALRNCRRVAIRGLSFLNCGHFALLLTGVDDLVIDGVVADTNRDGFDIDCCERVTVRNCRVNTLNDDAIVLKCSYALGWPKPTSDVVIEDCHVSGYDVGTMLNGSRTTLATTAPDGDGPTGRIKLGTESNGGFHRINIRRCTFTHCRGLALETVDGAAMHDIDVSDLTMHDICNSPIYIRLGDRMRAPEGFHPSQVHDIRIRNVSVSDADCRYAACLIVGTSDKKIRNVKIEDVRIEVRGGLSLADVEHQRGCNPFFFEAARTGSQRGVSRYPEPSAHGIQPAWGISVSHAEGILFRNIILTCLRPDERPPFHQSSSRKIRLKRVSFQ